MTDIVEQTARVLSAQTTCDGKPHPTEVHRRQAQALADAGLLAEPARTVPTKEEIAKRVHPGYGRPRYDVETCSACERAEEIADAILALIADQPTVAEVQEQWADYISETTGSVGSTLTLESLAEALRAPHPPFGGPHKNEDQK